MMEFNLNTNTQYFEESYLLNQHQVDEFKMILHTLFDGLDGQSISLMRATEYLHNYFKNTWTDTQLCYIHFMMGSFYFTQKSAEFEMDVLNLKKEIEELKKNMTDFRKNYEKDKLW